VPLHLTDKMKRCVIAVAAAALCPVVGASMGFRNSKYDLKEGQPFTLQYDGCDQDPCAIYLERMISTTGHETLQTITGPLPSFPQHLPSPRPANNIPYMGVAPKKKRERKRIVQYHLFCKGYLQAIITLPLAI